VVSFDSDLALASPAEKLKKPSRIRQQPDWVRSEVRCLMCARLIGRPLGTRNRYPSGDRAFGVPISFFAYRSADTSQPVVAFTSRMRFRCTDCGGTGAVDDVEFFPTYDELPASTEDV
jgi:ribosomal protein S27E